VSNSLSASEIHSCHLGVIFALSIESGFFEDSLQGLVTIRGAGFKAKEGGLDGRRVVVFLSRPGRMSAATAAEVLIDGHKPTLVLSAGFAGGLSAQLKRHDLLIANEVLLESGESIAIPPFPTLQDLLVPTLRRGNSLPRRSGVTETPTNPDPGTVAMDARASCPCVLTSERGNENSFASDIQLGKLLTTDRIIRTIDEKKLLFEQTGALAVDMETFAVAEACRHRNIPFSAVRVIHDPAGQTLPPDIEKLLHQKTEAARLGAAVGALWKRPSSIKDMWALKENSLVASKKLAEFVAKIAETL
jgi:adenosylhomocysteine nucleosidase